MATSVKPGISADADVRALAERRLRRMSGRSRSSHAPPTVGLPPGPGWPAALQTLALFGLRHRFVPWAHRRYGDVFCVRLLPGGTPLVLVARPEHAREIFAGSPADMHAGKGNAILGPMMGQHSLLLQDGEDHQRSRKLLMPAFNGHALRDYRALVTDLARAEVGTWRDGERFAALDRMNRLTLEVILRVVFGVTDADRLAAMRPRVQQVVGIAPVVVLGYGMPALQRFGPWRAAVENAVELDALIHAEIRERRAALAAVGADGEERHDVLTRLLLAGEEGDRLSDEELRDQLVTLLLAGHETTATALAWALYELGLDRELMGRAREAVRTDDDDWLEAVLKESMRLHPVIPMVVRTLQRPARVGGLDLPAGVTVGPSILLAHARPESHPSPRVFRPERFVGNSPEPHTWIPFGGGVRRCIGAGFSLMEGVAVLREVLGAYEVEATGGDRPRVRNITSVPRHGARVRVRRPGGHGPG